MKDELIEYRERELSERSPASCAMSPIRKGTLWYLANTDSLILFLLHRLRASSREVLSEILERAVY
jgi:hypothetical protein